MQATTLVFLASISSSGAAQWPRSPYDIAPVVLVGKTGNVVETGWKYAEFAGPTGGVSSVPIHVLRYFKGKGGKDVTLAAPTALVRQWQSRRSRAIGGGQPPVNFEPGGTFLFFLMPESGYVRVQGKDPAPQFRALGLRAGGDRLPAAKLSFDRRLPARLQVADLIAANLGSGTSASLLFDAVGIGAPYLELPLGWDYPEIEQALRWVDESLPRRYRPKSDLDRLDLVRFQVECGLGKYDSVLVDLQLRAKESYHGILVPPEPLGHAALDRLLREGSGQAQEAARRALWFTDEVPALLRTAREGSAEEAKGAFYALQGRRPYAREIIQAAWLRLGKDPMLDAHIAACLDYLLGLANPREQLPWRPNALGISHRLRHLKEIARIEYGIDGPGS